MKTANYFLLLSTILIIIPNIVNSDMQIEPEKKKTGGECIYEKYPGVATIEEIKKTNESAGQVDIEGGPGYEGYEVWFSFKPKCRIDEDWAAKQVKERKYLFQLINSWYPGPEYLKKYGIKEGKKFDSTLKVITKGTCTPIIFEFAKVKQDDYFESKAE